ncbi:hypothetical protein VLF92_13285, partial [Pseudomonas chengduensis]
MELSLPGLQACWVDGTTFGLECSFLVGRVGMIQEAKTTPGRVGISCVKGTRREDLERSDGLEIGIEDNNHHGLRDLTLIYAIFAT